MRVTKPAGILRLTVLRNCSSGVQVRLYMYFPYLGPTVHAYVDLISNYSMHILKADQPMSVVQENSQFVFSEIQSLHDCTDHDS